MIMHGIGLMESKVLMYEIENKWTVFSYEKVNMSKNSSKNLAYLYLYPRM